MWVMCCKATAYFLPWVWLHDLEADSSVSISKPRFSYRKLYGLCRAIDNLKCTMRFWPFYGIYILLCRAVRLTIDGHSMVKCDSKHIFADGLIFHQFEDSESIWCGKIREHKHYA